MRLLFILSIFSALSAIPTAHGADMVIVQDGRPKAAIYVAPEIMAPNSTAAIPKAPEQEIENQRQRLRESVRDLAHYLEKMSGAKVEVLTTLPAAGDSRLPILIGDLAVKAFGPPGKKAPYQQGFRVVVSPKGIGLMGESNLAASYAIFEALDRLGCRWFMPSEMGEVIPEKKTVALPEMDFSSAPGTLYRGIWYCDDAYRRRNRMGGFLLNAGHALEMYLDAKDREAHPEWKAIIGGKPHAHRLKWSSEGVANAIADKIIAQLDASYTPSVSLSPDDGADFDESEEDRKLDSGEFDVTNNSMSLTDRLLFVSNRIAKRVNTKYPDVKFGVLSYAQYVRPPQREKVHPNVVPQLAPIAYSRAHPMTDDKVPGNDTLRRAVETWGKISSMVSYYFYAWFPAETTAPNPMTTKWSVDLPIIYQHNCQMWQPETISNFETSMHGLYLGLRMAWNPKAKPAEIIEDLNTKFYGNAAAKMTAYWNNIDDQWIKVPEYSGCGFAYRRRFTPEAMKKARKLMDEGKAACKTTVEKQRVEIADESLKLFELFMKLREDLAAGRFANLESEAKQWDDGHRAMGAKYDLQYAFGMMNWCKPDTIGTRYFDSFYGITYKDATRIARDFQILTTPPISPFRFQTDKEKKGESLGWQKPDFDDKAWKTTDPTMDSWSAIGCHDYFGPMWYRANVKVPAVPSGKKVHLWVGATDGIAKVFVNGKLISYVTDKGEKKEQIEGYCQPFSWDITEAIKPDAENQIALLCTRTFFNELGTGGLLGPVLLYQEKP